VTGNETDIADPHWPRLTAGSVVIDADDTSEALS